ncbi:RNA-binding protein Musashi homolog 2-like isoform X2 [Hydractinia symbiolongicarpus]|uniref:RNA-binding protein Musashi homolog 2-like isoform X2 n=1 Tax=Hydractinia symbiolongicarpus TaxID=13093 RepID=UPI00254C0777|nr:RNA-binding protein Musashi homolog 2-like isoform X2 [Hydractinia symbiolongicarpus]
MAQHIQQIAPIPNGGIPVMPGVQQTIVYQQQPLVMAPQQNFGPRKPFRSPQDEQCKIFVGGVGKHTSEESLRAYFGKFGEISDSVIMKDKQTGEPRGFAFVTYKLPSAVQAVIDQCNNGGHTLDGKVFLQVRKYFPKAEYDAEKANQAQAGVNQQYKGPMKVAPELKVFIGGIGIGTTEEDVRKYFSTFGTVVQVDMPYHHVYKCPKGFAFVGFESFESVAAVTKDRYHQINGKTVEVKGSDEQQAHLNKKRAEGRPVNITSTMGRGAGKYNVPIQQGSIATVSGYGAYANVGSQQVIIPQGAAGVQQYAAVQPPAAGGGYVFDPATNTYYQLPGTVVGAGGGFALGAGSGMVSSMGANQYAGMTLVGGAGGQILTSPQLQRPGVVSSDMFGLAGNGTIAIGGAYASETSTFGPTRTHLLGTGQQPIAGSADPHVVYSTATSISAGDAAISTPRGFHPYGR